MKQLTIFDKLPANILQKEWEKEYIKNPPPFVTEQQRTLAKEKLNNHSSLRGLMSEVLEDRGRSNLTEI